MRVFLVALLSLGLILGPGGTYAFAEHEEGHTTDSEEASKKVGAKPAGAMSTLEDEMEFLEEEQHIAIVVTASKHGQKITEAPAAVTVISSEDIQASGAVNIADLFRRVPGLDFMQVSARDFNLNTRGFNNTLSRRLLVLVDGRSVYLDLMGFVPWDLIQIPIDDIERIEVVRGPGSALYGANATSGVVNIITKSPKAISGGAIRVGYGEFNTTDVAFVAGQGFDKFGYKVSLGYYSTDAFTNPNRIGNSEFQQEDQEATAQPKGTFRMQYDIDDDSRWVMDAGYAETKGILYTGIGPLEVQEGSNTPFFRTTYAKGNFYVQGFWNGLDGETIQLFTGTKNFFKTNTYDIEAQYNFQAGDSNFFVVGGNYRFSDLESDLTSKDESENLYGVYAQDEIKLSDKWTATLAARVDNDELIGTVFAPKAAILFAPNPNHSFRFSASTAYNSSSFIESYLDTEIIPEGTSIVVDVFGNPDLDPERIVSYELGYRAFPVPEVLLDINFYYSELDDFVQFVPVEYFPGTTIPSKQSYINAGTAEQTGVELSVEWYPTDHLSIFASYSYTDTEQDQDVTDVTADNKASLTIQYIREKGFNGSLSATYSDELTFQEQFPFYPSATIDSYVIVNGSAKWLFLDDGALSIGLRGTNLTDKKHQQFVAGDIIERKVIGEIGFRF